MGYPGSRNPPFAGRPRFHPFDSPGDVLFSLLDAVRLNRLDPISTTGGMEGNVMFIGVSLGEKAIPAYRHVFPVNDIMRVFPVKVTVGGKPGVRVLPKWDDPRLRYCHEAGVMPFLSTKIDGYGRGLDHVSEQLQEMPGWILDDPRMVVYLTDRHEPENDDIGPDRFHNNFAAYLAMVDSLPRKIRAKIRCGPILTRTWVDDPHKGKKNWRLYDPATVGAGGDFFGGDMYVDCGTRQAVVSPATLPSPTEFTASFKAYRYDDHDNRTRLWPEFGLIGMPADRDGSARATWIRAVYDEVSTWQAGRSGWHQPWSFGGFIWWNQKGNNTGEVAEIGGRRDFELDERTVDSENSVKLPGSPPLPVAVFNGLIQHEHLTDRPPHAPTRAVPSDPAGRPQHT